MKTIFCDIDGTLVVHDGNQTKQITDLPVLLSGTIETINKWDRQGHRLVLTTGRRESARKTTEKQLSDLGIFYDQLVMGIGGFGRVLINDRKPDGRNTAFSYNIDRNIGIANLDIDEATRPWGHYQVLLDDLDCKVKKIVIKPGQRPSYQYHHKRTEQWAIVKGEAKVTIDDKESVKKAGSSIKIPVGARHRIENIGTDDLVFIEVQLGEYFGEDDIVRVSDDYNR